MRTVRAAALLATVVLTLGGCRTERLARPFSDGERRAEEALRETGRSLFEVLSFRAEGHEQHELRDSYRLGMNVYRLRFVTEIRYLRDVRVRSREEVMERLRQPDATAKEIEQEIVWRRLLGAGAHPSGSTQVVRNVIVFEETEADWRLVAVDGPELETH